MCSIPHSHAIRDRGFFGCACPGRRCYSRIFARICAPAAHSHVANRPPPFANPATLPRVAPMAPSGGAQGSFGLRGLRVHALHTKTAPLGPRCHLGPFFCNGSSVSLQDWVCNVSLQPLIERQLHCQLQDLQQDPNGHQRPPKKYVATYCCTLGPCPLFRPSKFVHRPRSADDGRERYQAGARYLMRIHETLADRFPASCVEAEKSVGVPPHEAS